MNTKKLSSPIVPRNIVAIIAAKRFALSAYPSAAVLWGAACSGDLSVAPWCVLVYLLGQSLSDTLDQTLKLRIADYCPEFKNADECASEFPAAVVSGATFACVCSAAAARGKHSLCWSIAGAAAAALALNTGIHVYRDLARAAELCAAADKVWFKAGVMHAHRGALRGDQDQDYRQDRRSASDPDLVRGSEMWSKLGAAKYEKGEEEVEEEAAAKKM